MLSWGSSQQNGLSIMWGVEEAVTPVLPADQSALPPWEEARPRGTHSGATPKAWLTLECRSDQQVPSPITGGCTLTCQSLPAWCHFEEDSPALTCQGL